MDLNEFFAAVGGDAQQVLGRLSGETLVRKFLAKLLDDPTYDTLKTALRAEDLPTAFRAAHTLKGTAANLGLDALARSASALTEQLRGGDTPPQETLVTAVDQDYSLTVQCIRQLGL